MMQSLDLAGNSHSENNEEAFGFCFKSVTQAGTELDPAGMGTRDLSPRLYP